MRRYLERALAVVRRDASFSRRQPNRGIPLDGRKSRPHRSGGFEFAVGTDGDFTKNPGLALWSATDDDDCRPRVTSAVAGNNRDGNESRRQRWSLN